LVATRQASTSTPFKKGEFLAVVVFIFNSPFLKGVDAIADGVFEGITYMIVSWYKSQFRKGRVR